MKQSKPVVTLRRVLSLPLLIFYGLGVTIGAGIFALIGEILGIAGDAAPAAFLLAGLIAGTTGVSYAILSGIYPRAGGEAIYVNVALGSGFGRLVGYGVTTTAIISSAVITLSFSGYVGSLLPISQPILVGTILLLLAIVASVGVRESVLFAASITVLEVGTLALIIIFGGSSLADSTTYASAITPVTNAAGWSLIMPAAVIAFFAFIGFEDLVNMAEETVDPRRIMPQAIIITLVITVVLYTAISLIAISVPDRESLTSSSAPLATLFQAVTGFSGKPIAAMASIAMINGVLIQILMASRVIYGMSREALAPSILGTLHPTRKTPMRAIAAVTILIAILAFGFPLLYLAQATSLVTLTVFLLVNVSLWQIGRKSDTTHTVHRWRYWGLFGVVLTGGLLASEIFRLTAGI